MKFEAVRFTPLHDGSLRAEVRSTGGRLLRVTGRFEIIEPTTEGDDVMVSNPTLVKNVWAFAKHRHLYRTIDEVDQRESHRKQADAHAQLAENLADLIDRVGAVAVKGWCSACYIESGHRRVDTGKSSLPAYICVSCGAATLGCFAPHCDHMASRGFGTYRIPRYCAEHRHDIPSFERAGYRIKALEEYGQFLEYDKANLARATRLAATGLVTAGIVGTGGLMAAPAIGGAVGSFLGYSGAVATNAGLAMLGGGSIAAGGLGMAGGTYVVAAAGAALGSALGASVTNAYVSQDKSFKIELFRPGVGTPVIVTRGFMNEKSNDWRAPIEMVEQRYPDNPIYKLHWGSKELARLGALVLRGAGGKAAVGFVGKAAARASKVGAAKLGPIAPALLAREAATNPWHTAKVRADKTGVALAGILARTDAESFILIGHSLGARVMITAAQTLGTQPGTPRIDTIHTLGAAIDRKGNWRTLSEAVSGSVHNYYSTSDNVLKYAYAVAQAGSVAAGRQGFGTSYPNIIDHDVTARVAGHSDYFSKVNLT
jgi:pimeloyl-ACP methyl ester carboxylesterase